MEKPETNKVLSMLWLFVILNYLYCDIVGLMDAKLLSQFLSGTVGGMKISQGFLFAASILMEIPIAMVILCHLLSFKPNRVLNITAGVLMTLVQLATLIGTPTVYYIFFSTIEIGTTACIAWKAWRWQGKPMSCNISDK
jgi:hypothetical protein